MNINYIQFLKLVSFYSKSELTNGPVYTASKKLKQWSQNLGLEKEVVEFVYIYLKHDESVKRHGKIVYADYREAYNELTRIFSVVDGVTWTGDARRRSRKMAKFIKK